MEADDRDILQNSGKITALIAKYFAESEFDKYRIVQDRLILPLYYTGLKKRVKIVSEDGTTKYHQLNEQCELSLPVKIKAGGTAWFIIEE